MTTPVVYDIETFPNVFTLSACTLGNPADMFTWEISPRRNDIHSLREWLNFLSVNKIEMIGFNNVHFDYPVLHLLMEIDTAFDAGTIAHVLYNKAFQIISAQQPDLIWPDNRYIPQIDLYKIHHFDNKARTISLKGLEINMRSASVEDLPFTPNVTLTPDQIPTLIAYNRHDVEETDKFAGISSKLIDFRRELVSNNELTGDVINFNDTKIGKQYFIQQLGEERCYIRNGKRREPRQTPRASINLGEIIFPYVQFSTPEFQSVLNWLKQQTITDTNGVFKDLEATINGFTFHFGTGGIHGSVERRKIVADDDFMIIDIDVTSLYPSIAIVNRIFPAHLGDHFVEIYADIKKRRTSYKKGTTQNAMLKLALNGVYGDTNNIYSPFYDPQYTMTITINGQLLLCMLAEWLMTISGIEIIQINTDGVTARVPRSQETLFTSICKQWELFTCLDLERADYSQMWIRDVNNYFAEYNGGQKWKAKGAYNYPEKLADYEGWWHMDYSSLVVPRAARMAMLYGVDPRDTIQSHTDPFDFMLRARATGASILRHGDTDVQRTLRYFIATDGQPLFKISPPAGTPGEYKRKNKVSEREYWEIKHSLPPGTWDARIHTANKSRYEDRKTAINAGWLVALCNRAEHFDWNRLDRTYYVKEAEKLVIE